MRQHNWACAFAAAVLFWILASALPAQAVPQTYYINNEPLLLNAGGSPTCSNCPSGTVSGYFTYDPTGASGHLFDGAFSITTSADPSHGIAQGSYIGGGAPGTTCTSVVQGAHSLQCTAPSGTIFNFGEVNGHPGYFTFSESSSSNNAHRQGADAGTFSCNSCIFASTAPVPEPASLALLLSGLGGLGWWRYRTRPSKTT